jgi:hypothetical protein
VIASEKLQHLLHVRHIVHGGLNLLRRRSCLARRRNLRRTITND